MIQALVVLLTAAVILSIGSVLVASFTGLVYVLTQVGNAMAAAQARRRDALAAKLGLERSGAHYVGKVAGTQVWVVGKKVNDVDYATFRWGVAPAWKGLLTVRDQGFFDFGKDVQLGDSVLDRALFIRGCERTAQAVLLDPHVQRLYQELRGAGELMLQPEGLRFRQRGRVGPQHRAIVDHGGRLVMALESARIRPWKELAERFRLDLTQDGTRLRGHVGGLRIEVRQLGAARGERVETVIHVPLPRKLPADTHVTRHGSGIRLGDPILDSAICVKGDAAALASLLCDDETRALLMTVVHGFPGSEVTESSVVLRVQGRLMDELDGCVRDVVSLAKCLQPHRSEPGTEVGPGRVGRREKQSS